MSTTEIREYSVKGMTCQHCVESVQSAATGVAGVEVASVNLGLGLVTIAGQDFSDEAVRSAITEAGYEIG